VATYELIFDQDDNTVSIVKRHSIFSESESGDVCVTGMSIDHNFLCLTHGDGFLDIYHIRNEDDGGIHLWYRAFFLHGSAIIKNLRETQRRHYERISNELEEPSLEKVKSISEMNSLSDPWRSITDMSWDLSFPLVFHYNIIISNCKIFLIEGNLYIFVKLSTGDLFVYKSLGSLLEQRHLRFKRLIFKQPLNIRVFKEEAKLAHKDYYEIIVNILETASSDIEAFRMNRNRIIVSSPGVKTGMFVIVNGEVMLHYFKNISEEKLLKFDEGLLVFRDMTGAVVLGRLFEPENYTLEHTTPFYVASMKEQFLKVLAIEKDGITGLIILSKSRDIYRARLFDTTSNAFSDTWEFGKNERVVGLKKLHLENKSYELEDFVVVMYLSPTNFGMFSKWRLARWTCAVFEGKKTLKWDLKDEYTDQEPNEVITSVFSINEILFVTIENRILQFNNSPTYKYAFTYSPNFSVIVDTHVVHNTVLLTNIRCNILLMTWNKEQSKLIQIGECNFSGSFLYTSRLLGSEQTRVPTNLNSDPDS
jgi:hypothetical protein